jgi:dihydroorotate dehydrogenase (NAD+) catalytic subunit
LEQENIWTRKPKEKITRAVFRSAIKPRRGKSFGNQRNVDIPIIGIGGIMNWMDAVEFMIAGATAVEIGTVNFINPNAGVEIVEGLKSYCEKSGIKKLSEITASYQL